jgi:hypothetical protein
VAALLRGRMRILIGSKNDLTANLALNHLLPRLRGHDVGLLLANRARAECGNAEALMRLRMAEELVPRHMLFPLLDGLSAPGPDLMSFRHLAERHCDFFQDLGAGNRAERRDALTGFKPDLVLALKYGFLFSAEERAIPAKGILNLHSGALPAMPGLHAVYWALHSQMETLGCTVHKVDAGIDTGEIIDLRQQPAKHDRCVLENNVATYILGAEMLADAVDRLADGSELSALPQDGTPPGPYLHYPKAADIESFARRGGVMVDEAYYLSLLRRYLPEGVQMPVPIPVPAPESSTWGAELLTSVRA